MEPLLAAVVQLTSTAEIAQNLERAAEFCRRAARRGARLVVLPENFAFLSSDENAKLAHAVDLQNPRQGDIVSQMRQVAAQLGISLILGGLPERAQPSETTPAAVRVYNTCVHLGPDGAIETVYRKIHLFDVDFGAAGTALRESDSVEPGDPSQAVLAETPWGKVGLSVCYDLRFPELYRRLSARGARILVVPAAFTLHTGKDHWHLLLRARAVENQCFVLAAAQQGRHSQNRQTYGHSLIVDPWGTVLAECPDGEGMAIAELDFVAQERMRSQLPALLHRRIADFDEPGP